MLLFPQWGLRADEKVCMVYQLCHVFHFTVCSICSRAHLYWLYRDACVLDGTNLCTSICPLCLLHIRGIKHSTLQLQQTSRGHAMVEVEMVILTPFAPRVPGYYSFCCTFLIIYPTVIVISWYRTPYTVRRYDVMHADTSCFRPKSVPPPPSLRIVGCETVRFRMSQNVMLQAPRSQRV